MLLVLSLFYIFLKHHYSDVKQCPLLRFLQKEVLARYSRDDANGIEGETRKAAKAKTVNFLNDLTQSQACNRPLRLRSGRNHHRTQFPNIRCS